MEDATANGLVPALPWMLKVIDEEVALIPRTVPLSKSVEVASVEDPEATCVIFPPTNVNADIGEEVPIPSEPTDATPPTLAVPVAVKLATERLPEKSPFPCTDSVCEGEVVPRPKRPAEVNTEERVPDVL